MRSLLHISDVHFGPKHLEDRAAAVLALIRARRPDYVVISGDLTQRAKPEQFAAAKRFVESLPCPTLAVPGNHDVPLYRFWERLVVPFGAWRKHFSPHLEPQIVDDEVCMVGLNTAFNRTITGGRITRAQCRRLRDLFDAAPPSCYRIAVIHHNLVRPDDLDDVPSPLQGSVPALAALASSGVEMVLSGHLHQSYVAPLQATGGGEGGIRPAAGSGVPAAGAGVILCAGTTTSSRGRGRESGVSSCHWIEIGATEARVQFYRWDPSALAFQETATRGFARRPVPDRATATGAGSGA